MRIRALGVSLLAALSIYGGSLLAATVDDLVGLGMKPELAEYVAGLSTVLSNAEWIQATDQAGTGTVNMIRVDATDDTVINCDSGDLCKISVAGTPVAAVGAATPVAAFTPGAAANWVINGTVSALDSIIANGGLTFPANKGLTYTAYVPTLVSTPVAGTNDLKLGLNVIPTAAANAAAILPTPSGAGVTVRLFNSGPNAVRAKAGGTNTINGSSAGAYIPIATLQEIVCTANSATNWGCSQGSVPTPAGP